MKFSLWILIIGVASIPLLMASSCPVTFTDPVPRPTATVTPTATPTDEPSPTPAPKYVGAPPWNTACNLPASTGTCDHSTPGGPSGRGINSMDRVMQEVFKAHPEFFEYKGTPACSYKLKKAYTNAYYQAWLDQIDKDFEGDVCAQWDGEQLNVKYTNAFSESYHPIRFDGDFPPTQCISDRNGIFMFTCKPANF